MSVIKNSLKKILPPPVNSFMREINRIVALGEKNQAVMQKLMQTVEQQEQKIAEQSIVLQNQEQLLRTQTEQLQEQALKVEQQGQCLADVVEQKAKQQLQLLDAIKKDAQAARNHAWQSQQNAKELLWADIFNDVSSDSVWLKNKSFSAGRWAVGYQYLYVVYRILNEVKPDSILELGLGQSTRLISQYAAYNSEVQHTVVEHDPNWIHFFQQDFQLAENSQIVQLEREYKSFREDDHVLAFANFKETFAGQKFDFISIDAPLGGEAIVYARIDILELLPDCLAESFIIVVDDFNRQGEKNTVKVLEKTLKEYSIAYKKGVYSGQKDCLIICSEDLEFVCSM